MTEFYPPHPSLPDGTYDYRGNDEKTTGDCYEQPVVSYQLGDEYGLGKLDTPQCPRAAEFIQELGEHYVPAAQNIIGACMDGRPGSTAEAVPNGAGGGLLYLVTDRLVRGNSDAINEANARVLGRIGQIPATVCMSTEMTMLMAKTLAVQRPTKWVQSLPSLLSVVSSCVSWLPSLALVVILATRHTSRSFTMQQMSRSLLWLVATSS